MSSDQADTARSGMLALFDRHRAELLRYLIARSGSREDAEDLLHEVWLKLHAPLPGPVANGRAYLFRIASNCMLDQLRARQRAMARDAGWLRIGSGGELSPEQQPDPAVPADEAIARRQEAALLERAIATLPPGAQRALRLYRLEGRRHDEIAQIMGISSSGVEKHLALAMRRLRQALADCGWYGPAASDRIEQTGAKTSREDGDR